MLPAWRRPCPGVPGGAHTRGGPALAGAGRPPARHRRAARSGCVMWVRCHCQPARLVIFNPCSIQARNPYQQAVLASGGRSVRSNHGSLYPGSQQASRVQCNCRWRPLKAIPVPCHVGPGSGPKVFSGPPRPWPVDRNVPPVLRRKNGCQPPRVMRRNSQRADKPRSASTRTVHDRGTARYTWRRMRTHARRQACLAVAARTTQTTGMAQPR